MQIPLCVCGDIIPNLQGLVWRLSEFAFLCGGFGRRTFYLCELKLFISFLGGKQNESIFINSLGNADRIFPFISIPSGVKPIICQKQLLEYGKFISKLEKSNYLMIVGYRFNLEDNHINSIIANWLRNTKHKLIYFNFNTNVDFNNISWVEGISRRDCKHNETIDLLKSITNVYVDRETAIDTYKKYMEYLENC